MDLIERQAAIDAMTELQGRACTKAEFKGISKAWKRIKQLPSAQPEIVRCKDCKHRASYWGNCRLLEEKYHQSVLVNGDNFCSMAERRTDELGDK